MDILSGLGNGFTVIETDKPLLVGGGVGVPPLYGLAKKLIENGLKPNVVLGFASAKDVFYKDEFESLGLKAYVATVDGTMGTKGFVTDAIKENNIECDYFYAGSEFMLDLCSEQMFETAQSRRKNGLRFWRMHGLQYKYSKRNQKSLPRRSSVL